MRLSAAWGLLWIALVSLSPVTPFAAEIRVTSGDAYVRSEGNRWTFGTASVERTIALEDGRLLLLGFKNKQSGREMVPNGRSLVELSPAMAGAEQDGRWTLVAAEARTLKQGELQFDLSLASGPLAVVKSYVVYPGSSVVREWYTCRNAGQTPLKIVEPRFLSVAARLGKGLDALDFHWMTGAERARLLDAADRAARAERPQDFDSYDPFAGKGERKRRGAAPPAVHPMGSESYAPWYALYDREGRDGLVIGWDYMGHWASQFAAAGDGTVQASLRVAGHKQTLAPGESLTTPKALRRPSTATTSTTPATNCSIGSINTCGTTRARVGSPRSRCSSTGSRGRAGASRTCRGGAAAAPTSPASSPRSSARPTCCGTSAPICIIATGAGGTAPAIGTGRISARAAGISASTAWGRSSTPSSTRSIRSRSWPRPIPTG